MAQSQKKRAAAKKEDGEAYKRMNSYLDSLGKWRKDIIGDGACLFRAVSDHLYNCQSQHEKVRAACVKHLHDNAELFSNFIPSDFPEYLQTMLNPKSWGGEIEIVALQQLYSLNIVIFHELPSPSFNSKFSPPIDESVEKRAFRPETIELCFAGNNHYDIVYSKRILESANFIQGIVMDIVNKSLNQPTLPVDLRYFNAEYNCWKDGRFMQKLNDEKLAQSSQWHVGDSCRVQVHSKWQEGLIATIVDSDNIKVFILATEKTMTVPTSQIVQPLQYDNRVPDARETAHRNTLLQNAAKSSNKHTDRITYTEAGFRVQKEKQSNKQNRNFDYTPKKPQPTESTAAPLPLPSMAPPATATNTSNATPTKTVWGKPKNWQAVFQEPATVATADNVAEQQQQQPPSSEENASSTAENLPSSTSNSEVNQSTISNTTTITTDVLVNASTTATVSNTVQETKPSLLFVFGNSVAPEQTTTPPTTISATPATISVTPATIQQPSTNSNQVVITSASSTSTNEVQSQSQMTKSTSSEDVAVSASASAAASVDAVVPDATEGIRQEPIPVQHGWIPPTHYPSQPTYFPPNSYPAAYIPQGQIPPQFYPSYPNPAMYYAPQPQFAYYDNQFTPGFQQAPTQFYGATPYFHPQSRPQQFRPSSTSYRPRR